MASRFAQEGVIARTREVISEIDEIGLPQRTRSDCSFCRLAYGGAPDSESVMKVLQRDQEVRYITQPSMGGFTSPADLSFRIPLAKIVCESSKREIVDKVREQRLCCHAKDSA
jgi:hypothetical protein